jgi:prolyl-tRNA synthetase
MDLNETKLGNAMGAAELRPAHEDEIKAVGAVPGYASPIGIKDVLVVVDDLIPDSANLVAGANEAGYHLRNVNYGRDYKADIVADIVAAEEGYLCPDCGAPMRASRGVEVGNIFKLGTDFSVPQDVKFLDEHGKERPVVMGSYGIGSGRLLACIAEEHHDEHGLLWPISVAPYHVHLVALRGGEEQAARLYEELEAAGLDVLYDDRDESPGVKFNDADIIGIPIRVTVSKRSLDEGGVEMKLRSADEASIFKLEAAVAGVQGAKAQLEAELAAAVVEVTYDGD